MERLRYTPSYQSLTRPRLIWGCERYSFFTVTLLSATLFYLVRSLVALIAAVLVWIVLVLIFQRITKYDDHPHFLRMVLRSARYQKYFPARSRATVLEKRFRMPKVFE